MANSRTAGTAASALAEHRETIDATFGAPTVEEILTLLSATPGEFASATRQTLSRMSPTSLKVTLRLIREAEGEPLSACLGREFRAVQRCVTPPSDFFEGIRAALVDKDRNPQWAPSSVEEVSDASVHEFFTSLGERELKLPLKSGFKEV